MITIERMNRLLIDIVMGNHPGAITIEEEEFVVRIREELLTIRRKKQIVNLST